MTTMKYFNFQEGGKYIGSISLQSQEDQHFSRLIPLEDLKGKISLFKSLESEIPMISEFINTRSFKNTCIQEYEPDPM